MIDSTARSVHWSPDGQLLLVGLGGSQDGKKQRKDGAFLMLDARTMKPLFEGRWVNCGTTYCCCSCVVLCCGVYWLGWIGLGWRMINSMCMCLCAICVA